MPVDMSSTYWRAEQKFMKENLHIPDVIPPPNIPPRSLERIRRLEEETDHHARLIVDLNRQINQLFPISSLPNEILCKIFSFVQDGNMEFPNDYHPIGNRPPRPRELAWIAVTQVCHRWRDAALRDPILWTRPTVCCRPWMDAALERSRMAGVTILVDDERIKNDFDVASAIARHMSHIVDINVTDNTPSSFPRRLFYALKSVEAPRLERLSISCARYKRIMSRPGHSHFLEHYPLGYSIPSQNVRIPDDAFLQATNLRHVGLSFVSLDWGHHLFTDSLTTLKLDQIDHRERPTMSQLRSLLGRLTGLKSLVLRQALPVVGEEDQPSDTTLDRVLLPSLEYIGTVSEGTEHEFFYSNVGLPTQIKCISGKVIYLDEGLNHNFRRLISSMQRASAFQTIGATTRSIHVGGLISPWKRPIINVKTATVLIDPTDHGGWESYEDSTSMKLEIHFEEIRDQRGKTSACEEFLSELSSAINWINLSELDLSELRIFMPGLTTSLANTLGTLSNIRTVVIGRHSARAFTDVLRQEFNEPPHSTMPIAFSGLNHLKLWDVGFNEPYELRSNQEWNDTVDFDHLHDGLRTRAKRGTGILKLTFLVCRCLTEDQVQILKETVGDVVGNWGEEISGYSEGEYYGDKDEEEDYE